MRAPPGAVLGWAFLTSYAIVANIKALYGNRPQVKNGTPKSAPRGRLCWVVVSSDGPRYARRCPGRTLPARSRGWHVYCPYPVRGAWGYVRGFAPALFAAFAPCSWPPCPPHAFHTAHRHDTPPRDRAVRVRPGAGGPTSGRFCSFSVVSLDGPTDKKVRAGLFGLLMLEKVVLHARAGGGRPSTRISCSRVATGAGRDWYNLDCNPYYMILTGKTAVLQAYGKFILSSYVSMGYRRFFGGGP